MFQQKCIIQLDLKLYKLLFVIFVHLFFNAKLLLQTEHHAFTVTGVPSIFHAITHIYCRSFSKSQVSELSQLFCCTVKMKVNDKKPDSNNAT